MGVSGDYPKWVLVKAGRHRCKLCTRFYEGRAWCWFTRPALTTMTVCEPCAEKA